MGIFGTEEFVLQLSNMQCEKIQNNKKQTPNTKFPPQKKAHKVNVPFFVNMILYFKICYDRILNVKLYKGKMNFERKYKKL